MHIYSVKKNSLNAASLNPTNIIHSSHNYSIAKTPMISTETNNYYFLQLSPKVRDLSWLKNKGLIHDYKAGEFAIIEPKNKETLIDIASYIHRASGQCGALQKLSSQPLSANQELPKPLIIGKNNFVNTVLSGASPNNILQNINAMVSWGTRFEGDPQGAMAGNRLKDLYQKYIPESRKDVELELVPHKGSSQKSLIARIIGSTQASDIIILGSHLDSINPKDNKNAPGADDNASGTSTNLEVFRLLMANNVKPKKTIEIHAYAAEEIGLVGSGEIADSYKMNGINVIAMVQFDMNGFSKDGKNKLFFVSNGTSKDLTQTLGELTDTYLSVPWSTRPLLFGSSDHAAWAKRGYPVAFPTENPFAFNRKIHTADDKTQHINQPEQMATYAKLGVAYLMHLSGF